MNRRAASYYSQTTAGAAREKSAARQKSTARKSTASCCARPAAEERRRPTQTHDTGGASAPAATYEDSGSAVLVVQARPASPLEVPEDFLCPITKNLMRDPVICADGHSYEREAITLWLSTHQASPKAAVGETHTVESLIPNKSLQGLIRHFMEHGYRPTQIASSNLAERA